MEFKKLCPDCGKELIYKTQRNLIKPIKSNCKCSKCAKGNKEMINKRTCPKCGKDILYKKPISVEKAKQLTEANKLCRSCIGAESMRGKSIYDVWVNKYGYEEANKRLEVWKEKQSKNNSGSNNSNYKNKSNGARALKIIGQNSKGKTLEEMYGIEKAKQIRLKLSKKSKGENNPMYGKPAPKKSGQGWSGYYKEYHFRSLLELSYLKYLIDNNINFESGESKKYCIKYTMDNLERNYFPDYYLINTQEIIEIKPVRLINTKQNQLKFEAAKNKLGNKFKVLTEENINKLDLNTIYNLFINKEIMFDKRYEEKIINYYNKKRDVK